MNRYLNSFFIAFALYSSAFGVILYQSTTDTFSDQQTTNENVSRVCFSVINEQTPTLKEEVKPEKKVEKKLEKKVVKKEVLQTPNPIAKATREPIKKELPKPTVSEEVQEVVQAETKIVPKQNMQKVVNTAVEETQNTEMLKARQDKFLSHLVEKINSNKSYPNMARRRVIEGNVEMKFHLLADGSVKHIKLISGRHIFKESAVEAISKSFPVEVDKALFSFPKELKITIAYILK